MPPEGSASRRFFWSGRRYALADTGSRRRGKAREPSRLVTEFATYRTGDYGRRTTHRVLIVQIERIVFAEKSAGDRVVRNNDRALITGEMHSAVDGIAFERNGGRGLKHTWAGVAYLDSPVDDVTRTESIHGRSFFVLPGADEEIRGPVRDDPAADRGAACN